jgi:hypothetical protein
MVPITSAQARRSSRVRIDRRAIEPSHAMK